MTKELSDAAKNYVETLTQFGPLEPLAQAFIEGAYWEKERHAPECGNEFTQVVALKEKLQRAVKTISAVQNEIGVLTGNSSTIFDSVRKAWNENALFLSQEFELQNEYLKHKP